MTRNEVVYHQRLIIVINTVALVLGIGSYILRLYARNISKAKFWYDDFLMGVGLLLATIPCICNYVGLRFGFGQHMSDISAGYQRLFMIDLYILEFAWTFSSAIIKLAVLLFYWRIFPNRHFHWAIYTVGGFVTAICIGGAVPLAIQCIPVASIWEPKLQHHCINRNPLYIGTAALGLIGDVFTLVLPIPMVWSLQVSRRQKIGLSILFLLGGLVCIVSMFRIVSLKKVVPEDITWTGVAPSLWSAVEVQLGVVSGNIPSLRPLFVRLAATAGKLGSSLDSKQDSFKKSAKPTFKPAGFTHIADRAEESDPDIIEMDVGIRRHGITVKTKVEENIDFTGSHSFHCEEQQTTNGFRI